MNDYDESSLPAATRVTPLKFQGTNRFKRFPNQPAVSRYVIPVGVSKNKGTPKSSILIGFSIIDHPFWGPTPIFGNTHVFKQPAGNLQPSTMRNQPLGIIGSNLQV